MIEDAAHAPLSYLNGRMAGRFGVASFYSFASTKYWPAGGGGLAVVHDASLARKLADTIRSLSPPSRFQELRNLALQAAKATVFHRRLYGIFGRPMRRWAEKWALLEPCLDLKAIQRSCAAVACRQALRFPRRVELQRANSLRLLSRLGAVEDVVLPRERPGAQYNYHLFPVLLRDREERAAVMAAMWAQVRRHIHDLQRGGQRMPAIRIPGRLSGSRIGGGSPDHIAEPRGPHRPGHRQRRAGFSFQPASLPGCPAGPTRLRCALS